MATHSKSSTRKPEAIRSTKPRATEKSAVPGFITVGDRAYRPEQLIEIGRRVVVEGGEIDARLARQAAIDASLAREQRDGWRLDYEALEKARHFMADINMAAVAVHRLAIDAGQLNELDAQWYRVATENIAKVICRKADAVASILGDAGFGNFEDEFRAERASM